MVAEAQALKEAAGGPLTDAVAAWLAPQYLLAAREKLAAAGEPGRCEVVRLFLHDWSLRRRGDHSAARLQLDREELEWQPATSEPQPEKDCRKPVQRPGTRRKLLPELAGSLPPETLKRIEEELRLL
jgi:hypothetical protein